MKYADESALYHKHFILAQILAHNSYLPAHGSFLFFMYIFILNQRIIAYMAYMSFILTI